VKLLLANNGVDPDSEGEYWEETPLWVAAKYRREAVVKLLLVKDGLDLNSKDKYGQTPLSKAASGGYGAVVKLLLVEDGVD
jgi:ankyrin repeat protein